MPLGEVAESEIFKPLPVPAVGPVVVVVVVVLEPPPRFQCAREIAPKYPAAGITPTAFCHAATAACVWAPKYPVAPAGIE